MSHIKKIAEGLNVAPILWALQCNPQLWDQNPGRTESQSSPHHGLSDIWARFAPPGFSSHDPHTSIWYPASDLLPIKELIYSVMQEVQGEQLGGVLITKIPPGAICKPHTDPGWHARFYEKFAVQIQSAPDQAFHFDGESLVTKPGDVFWFDNSKTHWVTNGGMSDRITMIICIKTDKEY